MLSGSWINSDLFRANFVNKKKSVFFEVKIEFQMRKSWILFSLSFIFLFQSCRQETLKIIKVPEVETVQMDYVFDIPELLAPRAMSVADSHLVFYESKAEHPFFIMSLPYDGSLYHALSRGRGPMEVISPIPAIIPADDGFQIVDSGDGSAKKYTFGDESLSVAEVVDIPFKISPAGAVLPFGEGFIYNASLYQEFMKEWAGFDYHYVDPKSGEITLMCQTPDWHDNVDGNSNVVFRSSSMATRPDGSLFAVFWAFHNRMIFYDSEGNVLKELALPLEGVKSKFDAPVFYRSFIAFDDEWIVAKYGFDGNEYHFYDWNGKLKKRIALDRSLTNVAFDFDSFTLYGVDNENDTIRLYSAGIKL